MKITPFFTNKKTFLKLTFEEWGFTALLGLFLPGFINVWLGFITGEKSWWPWVIFLGITIVADFWLISIKGKEENYFNVLISNRKIPNKIEGAFPDVNPISKVKSNDLLFP